MLKVDNEKDIKNILTSNEMVILYFSNTTCGACSVIKNKVLSILKAYQEVKLIDINGEEKKRTGSA